jgi:hypothetical protein
MNNRHFNSVQLGVGQIFFDLDDDPLKLVFLVFYNDNPLKSVSGKNTLNTPIIYLFFKLLVIQ